MNDLIEPFELARFFWGEAPRLFLLEIVVRTLVIYCYALALLRWIGGRSVAQLSVVEFLLVIALGSAVGDALFYPEVPLLHAMLVITTVVVIDKLIDIAIRRYRVVKLVVNGSPVQVIRDGVILKDGTLDRQIGDLELMELLRVRGIENLGQVRAAYLEANGQVSLVRATPPRPGLPIVPPWEIAAPPDSPAGETAVCVGCGAKLPPRTGPCAACADPRRTAAVMPRSS